MIRREARLRREYIYRKSVEEKQRAIDEKRQMVKKYVDENRAIPTHLRKDAIELQKNAEWGGSFFFFAFVFPRDWEWNHCSRCIDRVHLWYRIRTCIITINNI